MGLDLNVPLCQEDDVIMRLSVGLSWRWGGSYGEGSQSNTEHDKGLCPSRDPDPPLPASKCPLLQCHALEHTITYFDSSLSFVYCAQLLNKSCWLYCKK